MKSNICAIQSRMGSERLPKKSLLKLGNERIIERCYKSADYKNIFDKVIIATSIEESDDELCNFLESRKIPFFRGDLNNVLSRFINIAKKYEAKNIVRLTGDNPLIDPTIIKNVFDLHVSQNFDYTSNIIERNFPRGNDVECVTSNTLVELENFDLNNDDKEHVTLYIRKNLNNYRVGTYKGNYKLLFPQARLTVDYIEDYDLVNEIYTKLNLSNNANDVLKIDKFLSRNQDLLKINKHIEQKKVQESEW